MFRLLLMRSVRLRWRNLALMALALALATGSSSALLLLAVGSSDLSGSAVLAFGPNIVLQAKPRPHSSAAAGGLMGAEEAATPLLSEAALGRLGTLRHGDRIAAVAPVVEGLAELSLQDGHGSVPIPLLGLWFSEHSQEIGLPTAKTAALEVFSWWRVDGRLPGEGGGAFPEALLGRRLSASLGLATGDSLTLHSPDHITASTFRVSGILSTGAEEEDRVVLELAAAQSVLQLQGRMSRAYVGAVVVPDDALAARDPDTMSDREYERWYCTPYLGSVARQIEEAIAGSEVMAIRRVSASNTEIQERLAGFSFLMVGAVGAAAAVAVATATAARQLDRAGETALLLALGARRRLVWKLTLSESLIAAAAGGAAGLALGAALGAAVAQAAFGAPLPPQPLPLVVAVGVLVATTLTGTLAALRAGGRQSLSAVLRGG